MQTFSCEKEQPCYCHLHTTLILPHHVSTDDITCGSVLCLGQGRMSPCLLDGLHHALPQEGDIRAAIALPLEQLQAVDLALDRTVTPLQGQPGFDRGEVIIEPLGKAGERLAPARGRLRDPRLEGSTPARTRVRNTWLSV